MMSMTIHLPRAMATTTIYKAEKRSSMISISCQVSVADNAKLSTMRPFVLSVIGHVNVESVPATPQSHKHNHCLKHE